MNEYVKQNQDVKSFPVSDLFFFYHRQKIENLMVEPIEHLSTLKCPVPFWTTPNLNLQKRHWAPKPRKPPYSPLTVTGTDTPYKETFTETYRSQSGKRFTHPRESIGPFERETFLPWQVRGPYSRSLLFSIFCNCVYFRDETQRSWSVNDRVKERLFLGHFIYTDHEKISISTGSSHCN